MVNNSFPQHFYPSQDTVVQLSTELKQRPDPDEKNPSFQLSQFPQAVYLQT